MAHRHLSKFSLSCLLALLSGLSAMAVDMCLPALPELSQRYHITASQAQLVVSLFLLSNGLSLLFIGPLIDWFGRRPVMLGGLFLFTLSGFLCALAPNLGILLALRIIQGTGASCGPVVSRAVVRDLFAPQEGAKIFALITTVFSLAPMLAPTFGGFLLHYFSFHSIFVALSLCGLLSIALVFFYLAESRPVDQPQLNILRSYSSFLRHPVACGYALLGCLAFSAQFSYIVCSPFLLMDLLGFSPFAYGLAFGGGALSLCLGAQMSGILTQVWSSEQIIRTGMLLIFAAGLCMAALAHLQVAVPTAVLAPIFVVFFGAGFSGPQVTINAMAPVPHITGVASALFGAMQLASGSLSSMLISRWVIVAPQTLPYFMALCAVLSLVLFEGFVLPRGRALALAKAAAGVS